MWVVVNPDPFPSQINIDHLQRTYSACYHIFYIVS